MPLAESIGPGLGTASTAGLTSARAHACSAIQVVAALLAGALWRFHGERYALDSFVVMPNHGHVLVRPFPSHPLGVLVRGWKSFSAREINRALERSGSLWHEEYWDRLIRDEAHLAACRQYISDNPTKARLNPSEYLLSPAE